MVRAAFCASLAWIGGARHACDERDLAPSSVAAPSSSLLLGVRDDGAAQRALPRLARRATERAAVG